MRSVIVLVHSVICLFIIILNDNYYQQVGYAYLIHFIHYFYLVFKGIYYTLTVRNIFIW